MESNHLHHQNQNDDFREDMHASVAKDCQEDEYKVWVSTDALFNEYKKVNIEYPLNPSLKLPVLVLIREIKTSQSTIKLINCPLLHSLISPITSWRKSSNMIK